MQQYKYNELLEAIEAVGKLEGAKPYHPRLIAIMTLITEHLSMRNSLQENIEKLKQQTQEQRS